MREKLIKLLEDFSTPVMLLDTKLMDWKIPTQQLREAVADHLIANGVTIQKWIPVSERLPEKRETVLVCDARVGYINAWEYLGRDEWLYDSSIWETKEITHWMPMPEPPKE